MFSVDNCQNEMNIFVCSSIKIRFVFNLNEKLMKAINYSLEYVDNFLPQKLRKYANKEERNCFKIKIHQNRYFFKYFCF